MEKSAILMEDVLAKCLHEIYQGNKTLEQCLQENPQHRDELEPLLNLSTKLVDLKSIQASESFRNTSPIRVINRIQHELAISKTQNSESSIRDFILYKARLFFLSFYSPSSRSLKVISIILVILFGFILLTSGVFIASAKSGPGEILYSAKIFFEQMELQFTQSEVRDSYIHITHATNRMNEATRLVNAGQYEYLDKLITEYSAGIIQSVSIVFESDTISEDERLVLAVSLLEDLAFNESQLLALLSTTPERNKPIIEEALQIIRYSHAAIVDRISKLSSNNSSMVKPDQEPPKLIDPGTIRWSTDIPAAGIWQNTDHSIQLTPYLSQTVFPSVNGTPFPWWYLDPKLGSDGFEWPPTWPTLSVPIDDFPFPSEHPLQDIDPEDLPDYVKTSLPDTSRDRTPVPRPTRPPRP